MKIQHFLRILCIDFLVSETSFLEVVCCFSLTVFYCFVFGSVLYAFFLMVDSDGFYVYVVQLCVYVCVYIHVCVAVCEFFCYIGARTLSDSSNCLGIFISHGR